MRTNIALAGLGTLTAFLLATNPVVADAARTISGKDIKNNSITGKDVKNGSLASGDFANGQLPAGPPGAPGASGAPGAAGAPGPAGAAGASAIEPMRSGQTVIGGARFGAYADTAADITAGWIPLGAVTTDPITGTDVMVDGQTPGETCAGTAAAPSAQAGKLCIYKTSFTNLQNSELGLAAMPPAAQSRGFSITISAMAAGYYADGFVWAYRQP